MSRIYIVEDEESIREIEAFALKNSGYEVEAFSDAAAFYERLREQLPDLIVLDWMLPTEDGITVLKKLRQYEDTAHLPVIFITAKTTELDKVKGLDAGADDYMTKPFGVMELISRVKALLRRTAPSEFPHKKLQMGELYLDEERRIVYVEDRSINLTYKEFELLRCLMANRGIVMTRDILMSKVWGMAFEGETRTVDMHIKTLRHKLGAEGLRIKTIRNVGYVME